MITLKFARKTYQISDTNVGGEFGLLPDGTLVRLEWDGVRPKVVEEIPVVRIRTHHSERKELHRHVS